MVVKLVRLRSSPNSHCQLGLDNGYSPDPNPVKPRAKNDIWVVWVGFSVCRVKETVPSDFIRAGSIWSKKFRMKPSPTTNASEPLRFHTENMSCWLISWLTLAFHSNSTPQMHQPPHYFFISLFFSLLGSTSLSFLSKGHHKPPLSTTISGHHRL